MMKYKDLIAKNDKLLEKELTELQKRLRELRFDMATKENKDTKAILNVRKDIARILTLKRERSIALGLEEEKKNES